MFYWMKPLPEADIDYEKYKPFIRNNWFRQNFMYYVYVLQVTLRKIQRKCSRQYQGLPSRKICGC